MLAFAYYEFVIGAQGGGVQVHGATAASIFDKCNIYGNTASMVSNTPPHATFPLPRWGTRILLDWAVARREVVSTSLSARLHSLIPRSTPTLHLT